MMKHAHKDQNHNSRLLFAAILLCLHFTPVAKAAEITADPLLKSQSWFKALGVSPIWSEATGEGVVIADCAAGFFEDEESLQQNYLLDHKYDLSDKDNPYQIDDGKFVFQGTASASIMIGQLDGVGSNGIAFNSKLVPLQNFNYEAELDDISKETATANCILRAITIEQVNIIVIESQTLNGSAETDQRSRVAVKKAIKAGLMVVTAAGDHSRHLGIEEKDDSGSIMVGSLRGNKSAANYSNYGKRITVSAIGEGIKTVGGPFGRLRIVGGTSTTAAQVAAIVALALEIKPHLSPKKIRNLLVRTRISTQSNKSVGGFIHVRNFIRAIKKEKADLSAWRDRIQYRNTLIRKKDLFY